MNHDLDERVLAGIAEARALASDGNLEGEKDTYRRLLDGLDDDPKQAAGVLHMFAVIEDDLDAKLALNEDALQRAETLSKEEFPEPLRATLYANIGWSHHSLGNSEDAVRWYERAQAAARGLDDDEYGRMMRDGIDTILTKLASR